MSSGSRGRDAGSVAVLMCALIAFAAVLMVAVAHVGGAVVLAGRAEAAADSAALAAADALALGSSPSPCAAARGVAEWNDARLVECTVESEAVEVVVELEGDGPAALGRTVRARARAEIDFSPDGRLRGSRGAAAG
jgi:secretion/DNA translocation related TadE-like protein